MAENMSIKKSPIDSVLECPLCQHHHKLPHTLQQCLHSYCKSCLDKVPQKTQDGRQGWLCPMCENFTKCDQVQKSNFIEELQKIHFKPARGYNINCEQCLEDCGPATWKCADCKIGLCENGKSVHLKIPVLKGHKIGPLDSTGESLIDNVVFCKVHAGIPAQMNCHKCEQLICYKCNTTNHQQHRAETVEQALERILPVTKRSANKVNENIEILEGQIVGINKNIEQTRESYSSCRMQMNDHLEKVICRMRAMKAQMEEDVNEQESITLDTLTELKRQLEKQISQARILSNLTAVVTNKTRHTRQLHQLQTGLFGKVKYAGEIKTQTLCLRLPTTNFIEGKGLQEHIDKVFGKFNFDMKEQIVSTTGESYTKSNQFLCSDFDKLAKTKFKKDQKIVVNADWCNRLSYINNAIWLPLDSRNKINIYDEDGELIKVIDTGDKAITVVKEAYNGDIICGGDSGLFVTDKQFSKWTMFSEGEFCDVVVDNEQLIALKYNDASVHTYSLNAVNTGLERSWNESNSFMLTEGVQVNYDSSICIVDQQDILISSAKYLYKFANTGEYLDSCTYLPVYPVICGSDYNNHVLVANFTSGTMCVLKPLSEIAMPRTEILSAVRTSETRSVVIDRNSNLWVLVGDSGESGFKLIKFAPEQ